MALNSARSQVSSLLNTNLAITAELRPEWPTNCYAQKICALACHPLLCVIEGETLVIEPMETHSY